MAINVWAGVLWVEMMHTAASRYDLEKIWNVFST